MEVNDVQIGINKRLAEINIKLNDFIEFIGENGMYLTEVTLMERVTMMKEIAQLVFMVKGYGLKHKESVEVDNEESI